MDINEIEENNLLLESLKEYEMTTDMTSDERYSLHEWVSEGHSPYTNPYYISNEKGYPMDYVAALQLSEEIRIQRYEELSCFDEIKSEREDLKVVNQTLKTYIMQLQELLKTKQINYPKFEMPDEIPF